MLGLLLSLLILLVVFAIVNQIPIPPQFRWVVNVVFGIIFLIAVIGLLGGSWALPIGSRLH